VVVRAFEGVVEHLLEFAEGDGGCRAEQGAGGAGDGEAAVDPDVFAVEVLGAVRAHRGGGRLCRGE
jgi:hypothetical protein